MPATATAPTCCPAAAPRFLHQRHDVRNLLLGSESRRTTIRTRRLRRAPTDANPARLPVFPQADRPAQAPEEWEPGAPGPPLREFHQRGWRFPHRHDAADPTRKAMMAMKSPTASSRASNNVGRQRNQVMRPNGGKPRAALRCRTWECGDSAAGIIGPAILKSRQCRCAPAAVRSTSTWRRSRRYGRPAPSRPHSPAPPPR